MPAVWVNDLTRTIARKGARSYRAPSTRGLRKQQCQRRQHQPLPRVLAPARPIPFIPSNQFNARSPSLFGCVFQNRPALTMRFSDVSDEHAPTSCGSGSRKNSNNNNTTTTTNTSRNNSANFGAPQSREKSRARRMQLSPLSGPTGPKRTPGAPHSENVP